MRLYHGSPTADLKAIDKPFSFFTPHRWVAQQYACERVIKIRFSPRTGPTIYVVDAPGLRILDFRNPAHAQAYVEARKVWNAALKDDDAKDAYWLQRIDAEGFIMRHTGLPGYGSVRSIARALPEFDAMWVDEGSQDKSLLVYKPAATVIPVAAERVECP